MRYLPFILLLALVVYSLVDCVRSEDTDMPVGLPKAVWVILIIIFPGAGAIAWLVVSRVTRQAQRAPGGTGGPSGYPTRPVRRPAPPRPVAPDDDPDFLASLDHRAPQTPEPETTPEPAADDEDDTPEGADNDDDGRTRP